MLSLSRNSIFFILLVIIASLPSVLPLLGGGFIKTDDGDWMVIRFSAFYSALSDGQFPVRWLPRLNHSFGYPVANFLYPGFMYLAAPFKLMGFSFIDSVKVVILASMIGSSLFCFLWLKNVFSDLAAFVGSLLYLYLPYHLFDLYQRGSVGEVLALSVVPFIFWQLERRSFIFSVLGIGLLILAHNTLALVFFPVIIGYIVLQKDFREQLYWYVSVLTLGVGLAGFFWIPALYDLQYTTFSTTTVSNWSEYFAQISVVGLSVPFVLLSFVFTFLNTHIKEKRFVLFFFILGLIALFLSTTLSSIIWRFLPISFIQFPFRMLSLLLLSISFLAAWVIHNNVSLKVRYGFILLALLLLSPSFLRLTGVPTQNVTSEIYATNEDTTTVKNEYMPVYVKRIPVERPKGFLLVGEDILQEVSRPTTDITFTTKRSERMRITYNQLYFPGWKASVDGNYVTVHYDSMNGVIVFPVDAGEHIVRIIFEETPLRLVADGISLISFLLVIAFPVIMRKIAYGKQTKIF